MDYAFYRYCELIPELGYQGDSNDSDATTLEVRGHGTGEEGNPHVFSIRYIAGAAVTEIVGITPEDLRRLGEFLVMQSRRKPPKTYVPSKAEPGISRANAHRLRGLIQAYREASLEYEVASATGDLASIRAGALDANVDAAQENLLKFIRGLTDGR